MFSWWLGAKENQLPTLFPGLYPPMQLTLQFFLNPFMRIQPYLRVIPLITVFFLLATIFGHIRHLQSQETLHTRFVATRQGGTLHLTTLKSLQIKKPLSKKCFKGPSSHLLGLRRKSLNVYGLSMVGSSVCRQWRKWQIKGLAHKSSHIKNIHTTGCQITFLISTES